MESGKTFIYHDFTVTLFIIKTLLKNELSVTLYTQRELNH